MEESSTFVTPGTRLGRVEAFVSGKGTYIYKGGIYATVMGYVKQTYDDEEENLPTIAVITGTASSPIPTTNSEVTAQVLRISPKKIDCDILCVDGIPVSEPFKGIIRFHDIREYEVDHINMIECFRPTDILRCKVVAMGDSRSYLLSTAGVHHGVIHGRSENGAPLQAVSWKFMRCSKTGELEQRKVACPRNKEIV